MSISTDNIFIKNLMLKTDEFPVVEERFLLKETLEKMNHFKLGVACVVDNNQNLKGVFTDGDFRRLLLKSQRPLSRIFIEDIIDKLRYLIKNREYLFQIRKNSFLNVRQNYNEYKLGKKWERFIEKV